MISVVINTLNEEDNISGCIESVVELADEIIVCDMHSDDRTTEIAEEFGARLFYHERAGYVEPARHYAISQALHEWVLVLDADERMTKRLAEKLKSIAKEDKADAVSFWSLFWYFGGWVGNGGFFSDGWWRFFRRGTYLSLYESREILVHGNFRVFKGHRNTIRLDSKHYILHLAYPNVEKYVYKTIGTYARIEAEQRRRDGARFSLGRLLGETAKAFVGRYIIRKGFKDGIRGLILCFFYAVFRFSVWANIWFFEEDERIDKA